ncbi:MAG: SH3 domain-containing protein, partial [Peptococcaceae bacterium]|nr:SH3 domain-containing protein [Peptococcaceae bacterium]
EEDARTKVLKTVPDGEKLVVTGSIRNADDRKWYIVSYDGTEGFVFTGDTKPESWFTRFRELLTGK